MMNRIIILSVFACFILYDLITWVPNKANTKPAQSTITDTSNLFTFSNSMDTHTIREISTAYSIIYDSVLRANTEIHDPASGVLSIAGERKTSGAGYRAFILYNGKLPVIKGSNKKGTILFTTESDEQNLRIISPARNRLRNLSGL